MKAYRLGSSNALFVYTITMDGSPEAPVLYRVSCGSCGYVDGKGADEVALGSSSSTKPSTLLKHQHKAQASLLVI